MAPNSVLPACFPTTAPIIPPAAVPIAAPLFVLVEAEQPIAKTAIATINKTVIDFLIITPPKIYG
jgi:hypothetical protein